MLNEDMRDDEEGAIPPWMRKALHDLAQPLTAMECRLFLAVMEGGPARTVEEQGAEMRSAITDALADCKRMMHLLRDMQVRLHAMEAGQAVDVDDGDAG